MTSPAVVLVFAAGTFGVGYAAKGGSVFVNRAALVETHAGQTQAGVYSEVGLFSPHRTTYDINLSGDNLLAAVPNPGISYGRGGGDDSQDSGPVQFVETPSGVSLPSTPVNMWAMRAFDAQSTVDLGGAIDGSLTAAAGSTAAAIRTEIPKNPPVKIIVRYCLRARSGISRRAGYVFKRIAIARGKAMHHGREPVLQAVRARQMKKSVMKLASPVPKVLKVGSKDSM